MDRIMVFNRLDAYLCDLDPKQVHDLRSVEEVNGEHALTITTTHQLEKTNRIVLKDGMGYWHEYVVTGIVDSHETDEGLVTEYYCVWSIQYDLSGTFVDNQYGCGIVPGHASVPHPVQDALAIALSTTNRWQTGTVNVTSMAAASFYRRSGWEAIQTVIEKWGGELQATIDVGQGGVVTRHVDLLEHVGASSATRRFDYGHDVASIKRTVSDEVWPCRIIPLGASQETDEGGYTRRPTIESVNSGVMWLEDADAVPLTRMPDGNGGWEYPTIIVENDTYEVPADLKAWALANITDYTRPRVTYEASVVQLARAGMNPHGVALGDEVVVVDREFGSDGLRISARVVKQECNLLDPTDTVLTIGNITDKLSGQLAELSRQVSEVAEQVASSSIYQSSTEYVSRLLERINNEANTTGGFTYITEGQGIRTYDVAVTDPLVGTEASSVVEVKGGTIRIANTKTAQGQWEWKTIFTSGYVNAEVIRAIGLLTGSHVEVDTNGVHIYDQNGTEVALYAPTVRIGPTAGGNYVTVDSTNGLDVRKSGRSVARFGEITRVGASNSLHVTVGDTYQDPYDHEGQAVSVSDASGGAFVDIGVTNMEVGNTTVPSLYMNLPRSWYGYMYLSHATVDDYGEELLNGTILNIGVRKFEIWCSGVLNEKSMLAGTPTNLTSDLPFSCSYETKVVGTASDISLRSNSEGNRGLYDVSSDEWILYRNGNTDNLVIRGLATNFDITTAAIMSGTSISGGGYVSNTTNVSKDGWTPIGVVGWTSSTRYAVTVRAYLSYRSDTGDGTVSWMVYNANTSSVTPTVNVYVLWARS